jgi:hypothetical protein
MSFYSTLIAPHLYMYSKAQSRAIGAIFAMFFFWFMNTPVLESYFDLPLSDFADDFSRRWALFVRLWIKNVPERFTDGSFAMTTKFFMSIFVFFGVTGFAHSLAQIGKVSGYIMKKDNSRFIAMKISIVLMAIMPPIILLTHMLPHGSYTAGGGLFEITPRFGRGVLSVVFIVMYFGQVRPHLQIFLEQAVQDCAKDMQPKIISESKVRMHFQSRASLLVYSASQMSCFGMFCLLIMLLAGMEGGMGTLGHAHGYSVGGETGANYARSAVYDNVQSILAAASTTSAKLNVCPILPFGAYPEEKDDYANWTADLTNFEKNVAKLDDTMAEIWDRRDTLQKQIEEGGGYGRAIFFHNELNFEEDKLVTKADKQHAALLKAEVIKVKRVIFLISYHTFISPPYYNIIADSLCSLACFLWVIVYGIAVLGEILRPNPLLFGIEVMDLDDSVFAREPVLEEKEKKKDI